MASIQESGFLSPAIAHWITKHRKEHTAWFTLADTLNRLAQRLMLSAAPPKGNLQKLLVALLFARVLSHFQGVILLVERGMTTEGRSLLRGMLDAVFAVVALSKDGGLVDAFVDDDTVQRYKLVQSFRALPKEIRKLHRLGDDKLEELANTLKKDIDERDIKPLRSEFLAQKAGMLGHYQTLFVLLSSSTHSRARDLERQVEVGPDQNVTELIWGPDVHDIDDVLMPTCECLFIAARALADLYGNHEQDAELEGTWKTYESLIGKA